MKISLKILIILITCNFLFVQLACQSQSEPTPKLWDQVITTATSTTSMPSPQSHLKRKTFNSGSAQSNKQRGETKLSKKIIKPLQLSQTSDISSAPPLVNSQNSLPQAAYLQRPTVSQNQYYGGSLSFSQGRSDPVPPSKIQANHSSKNLKNKPSADVDKTSSKANAKRQTPKAVSPTHPQESQSLKPDSYKKSPRIEDVTKESQHQDPPQTTKIASRAKTTQDSIKLTEGGILGSSTESVVLPSFDALYITLFGQPTEFKKTSPRKLDYNIWFLNSDGEQYQQTATFRYFLKKAFLPKTKIPSHPDCSQPNEKDGRIEVTCQGTFPFANGHMLRLIECGRPNPEILKKTMGDAANPLAKFIDQAWVQGAEDLWDDELCSERIYVDYVFHGTELQLRFPLEVGKVYFITQFPLDYLQKTELYGEPVPNHLGIHSRNYPTSRGMSNFLSNARILQVVVAVPKSEAKNYGATQEEKFINNSFTRMDYENHEAGKLVDGVSNNEYCLKAAKWDESQNNFEKKLFRLINRQRAQGAQCGQEGQFEPAPALDMAPALRCAARLHSQDMASQGFFSHYNLLGQSEWDRILGAALGEPLENRPDLPNSLFAVTGENIAQGVSSPEMVLREWMSSEGHCANLMNPNFTHMGTGYHPGAASGPMTTLTLALEWR